MMAQKSLTVKKTNRNSTERSVFERIVEDTVDEALSSLGNYCKQAIYLCLETRFNIKKEDIPNRIDDFANALEKMFGESSKLIKIEVMRLAYSKIRIVRSPTRKDALLFTDYIKALGTS